MSEKNGEESAPDRAPAARYWRETEEERVRREARMVLRFLKSPLFQVLTFRRDDGSFVVIEKD
jgi:hypothetical protein